MFREKASKSSEATERRTPSSRADAASIVEGEGVGGSDSIHICDDVRIIVRIYYNYLLFVIVLKV